jgi:hypothetical protein
MLTTVKGNRKTKLYNVRLDGGFIPLMLKKRHQEITESMSYRATLILDVIGDDNKIARMSFAQGV